MLTFSYFCYVHSMRSVFILLIILLVSSCAEKPKLRTIHPEIQGITLEHGYFRILYSVKHRLPIWTEYTVTKEDLKGPGKRRDNFHKDVLLAKSGISPVDENDFPSKIYDRGHMAPAADFKRSQAAIDETFVMSNMAPQKPGLNRRAWEKLEAKIRKWICGEEKLTIITGPILNDTLPRLKNGITVPEKFFKIIYDETPPLKSIAFIYSQEDSGNPLLNRVVSIKKVETEASLHFSKQSTEYPEMNDINVWKSCR